MKMSVTLEIQNDVALVTMDDGKKNAVTQDVLAGLEAALDTAESDAKAMVLAGRPGSFCAGFDLMTMTGDDPEARMALSKRGGAMTVRLYSFPKPLVAACTGHGFTIGAIWMAACDTRVGEEGPFKFGLIETTLGMTLPEWALVPLKERLNPAHFLAAIAQSKIYDPESALEAGFIDELVPSGQSIERACALATEFAALPGNAYAGNKLSMRTQALETMKASVAAN
jgi:enoyl-CoA hydratase